MALTPHNASLNLFAGFWSKPLSYAEHIEEVHKINQGLEKNAGQVRGVYRTVLGLLQTSEECFEHQNKPFPDNYKPAKECKDLRAALDMIKKMRDNNVAALYSLNLHNPDTSLRDGQDFKKTLDDAIVHGEKILKEEKTLQDQATTAEHAYTRAFEGDKFKGCEKLQAQVSGAVKQQVQTHPSLRVNNGALFVFCTADEASRVLLIPGDGALVHAVNGNVQCMPANAENMLELLSRNVQGPECEEAIKTLQAALKAKRQKHDEGAAAARIEI